MTDKVDTINTGIGRAFQIAESAAGRDQAAVSDAEHAIEQVLERFRWPPPAWPSRLPCCRARVPIHREI